MNGFLDFKKLILNQEFNSVDLLLENVDQKDLAKIISNILMSFYTDSEFYFKVKSYFSENYFKFGVLNKTFFDTFYLFNKVNVELNIKILIENDIAPVLFSKLLCGGLRNETDLLEKFIYNNDIDTKYHQTLEFYFLSKGFLFGDIKKILNITESSASKTKYQSDRIKVALLVSGQVRGLEPALKSWMEMFEFDRSNVEVDAYFSVWGKSGISSNIDYSRVGGTDVRRKIENFRKTSTEDELEEFIKTKQPPLVINSGYIHEKVRDYLNISNVFVDIEDDSNFLEYSNPMKLYYKIHRCFELSKKNGVYDIYIRLRPDLVLEGLKIDLVEVNNTLSIDSKVLCCYSYTYEYYGFGVDDKFAIAKYNNMEIYSNTWIYDKGAKGTMIGHTNLASNLFYHKVDVEKVDNLKTFFCNYNVF